MAASKKVLIQTSATEGGYSETVNAENAIEVSGTISPGKVPTVKEDLTIEWQTGTGSGDMTAAVYDPESVEGDAFDMDNMVESDTKKILTADERTKLTGIEALADVTDATNVAAAGAVMDGDFSANGLMKRTGAGTYSVSTVTAAGEALLDDADAAAQRSTLELGTMATKAAVDFVGGMIETAADKTYVIDLSAAYAYTVNTLIIKSASGTCTAKLTIEGTDITGISAVSVSSSEATGTATAANSVAVGNTLALVVSSNSDATDVSFTIKTTRA